MTLMDILRKFGVIIIALLALWLTRAGIGYLTILVAIGIIAPIVCGSKKDAVFTGSLYATLNYVLSYPSGLYLINYMPSNYIPITVSSSEVMVNLFIGWLVPTLVAIIVCGMASFLGKVIADYLFGKENRDDTNEFYFEDEGINQVDTSNLNKKERKRLLYLTPIQKAKNRKDDDE